MPRPIYSPRYPVILPMVERGWAPRLAAGCHPEQREGAGVLRLCRPFANSNLLVSVPSLHSG
jgi:hypothetical protein